MNQVVFYSWQSDLPNATNRSFIEKALEDAAKSIVNDGGVAIQPVVERDTKGLPGSPDIASAIFAKIASADVFVADISIIGKAGKREMPNPNVLVELGFALKALGHERVILVFNMAYGKIENLPFDLRMRRALPYNMPKEQAERAPERIALQTQLDAAIRAALSIAPSKDSPMPAVDAIEKGQPNKIIVLRRGLDQMLHNIIALEPPKHSDGGTADDLIEAINKTQELVAEFSKIAEVIAIMNDAGAARSVYQWFGKIFERYNRPPEHSGRYSEADQDYYKFVGHELFVTLIAFLLREKRWDVLGDILEESIPLAYAPYKQGPKNEYWEYASEHIHLLIEKGRENRRLSLHADILHDRHTEGGLSAVLPFDDFSAADYFLFLYGELPGETDQHPRLVWRPWSVLWMKHAPMFIRDAEKVATAERLAKIFKLSNATEMKHRLKERAHYVEHLFRQGIWDSPLRDEDINKIATR